MSNYHKIKEIVLKLNSNKFLNGKICIVGGIVPYLLTGKESIRNHSDIDIIVDNKNMNFIRKYLKENNLYNPKFDTLNFNWNRKKIDYGLDCMIDGIIVNFAPFKMINKEMVQRNFVTKQKSGINAFVNAVVKNVKIEECTTTTMINQVVIKTYNLEMVKIMKEKSNKTKDKIDIEVIVKYGYDEKKYKNLKEKTNNMKFEILPKSKVLKFLMR